MVNRWSGLNARWFDSIKKDFVISSRRSKVSLLFLICRKNISLSLYVLTLGRDTHNRHTKDEQHWWVSSTISDLITSFVESFFVTRPIDIIIKLRKWRNHHHSCFLYDKSLISKIQKYIQVRNNYIHIFNFIDLIL